MRKITFKFNPIDRMSLRPFSCDESKLYVLTKDHNDLKAGDIGAIWYSPVTGRPPGGVAPVFYDVIFEEAFHDRLKEKYGPCTFGAGRGDYCFREGDFSTTFQKYELGEDETLEVNVYTPKSFEEFKR